MCLYMRVGGCIYVCFVCIYIYIYVCVCGVYVYVYWCVCEGMYVSVCMYVHLSMLGGSCCFRGTGCRSAAMAAPLASLVRCEAELHGYGTSPLKEGG